MLKQYVSDAISIHNIYQSLRSFIHKTPLLSNESLTNLSSAKNLYFKCENFQKTGSFKIRGAVYALNTHLKRVKQQNLEAKEFITHSSGNHASALSYAGKLFNVKVRVVMPENAPKSKMEAVRHYGGEVTLCPSNQAAREAATKSLMERSPMELIHSSDNYLIIAGQSTVSYEIFREIEDLDYVLTPLGGGGLLAGTCLGSVHFSPKTKVIGVEPELANDAYHKFKQEREPKFLDNAQSVKILNRESQVKEVKAAEGAVTVADGLRIGVGSRNFEIMKQYLDDIITVDDDEIKNAMLLIWERMKIVVEPSSAVTFAAVLKEGWRFKNKNVAVILSGGNVDLRKLPFKGEETFI